MSLSDRDKIVVSVVALALASFLFFELAIKPLREKITLLDKKTESVKNNFDELTTLAKEYKALQDNIKGMEKTLENSAKNVSLPSLLENLVVKTNLKSKLTGLKAHETIKSNNFQENGVEVSLKEISIDELINFVYNLETLPYIIKVKGFKIKTTYNKDPKYINLTLLVSLFTPN